MNLVNRENFFFLLFLFLPVSIILGPTISLINIIFLTSFFLISLTFQKKFNFINHFSIKLLLILYLYLIFNSFISQDYQIGLSRNLGFIRLIILFIFINYFFFYYENEKKLLDFWTLILSFLIIDVFIEYFFDTNSFGWGASDQIYGNRITSFFKDEPIVGAYLAGFIFLIFGHLLKRFDKKTLAFIFLLIAFTALIFTGERSNTIKVFFGIITYFLFLDFLKVKTKLIIVILFITTFGVTLSQSNYLKLRYIGQFFEAFTDKKNFENFKENNQYIRLYKSGYSVFQNFPIFGVGNKNYRVETCKDDVDQLKYDYICLTHPHQLYFELLAEHGLFGFILILSIFFYLMFKVLNSILLSRNYIQIGAFIYILINFIPLLPSGSFFSDFNITLFWINFCIMFACNKKTNIFEKDNI
tara:strand:+ start:1827 stop:3068 length:1242 start_codon:yes stop_codon:yes gene_type:complete